MKPDGRRQFWKTVRLALSDWGATLRLVTILGATAVPIVLILVARVVLLGGLG